MTGNDSKQGKQHSQPQPSQPQRNPGEGENGVEGEGSYTATRRYNAGLREHLDNHDVEREAEEAREALEGEEGRELREAEQKGKRGPAQRQAAGSSETDTPRRGGRASTGTKP